MTKRYASRKWIATVAVLVLEFCAAITGIVKFAMAPYGSGGVATNFIIACFSAIASTLGFYFTVNAMQKNIVSKNFQPELVGKE